MDGLAQVAIETLQLLDWQPLDPNRDEVRRNPAPGCPLVVSGGGRVPVVDVRRLPALEQLIDRERPLVSAGLGSPSLDLGDQAAHRALGLALGAPHQP